MAATRAGFERIPNQAARNAELSLAALGLLTRLLVDGANFSSIDSIADHYAGPVDGARRKGRGRDAYRQAAKELEAAGYLARTRAIVNGVPANRIRVSAEPNITDVQSGPMPGIPSSQRAGESEQKASSAPTPGIPSPTRPPATRQTRSSRPTTDTPSSFLTDVSTDLTDHAPATPCTSLTSDFSMKPEEGSQSRKQPTTPAAVALVNALPYNRRQPSDLERAELIRRSTVVLGEGMPAPDLRTHLTTGLSTALDRIQVWFVRLDRLMQGETRTLALAQEARSQAGRPCTTGGCQDCNHGQCSSNGLITRDDESVIRCPCWFSAAGRF